MKTSKLAFLAGMVIAIILLGGILLTRHRQHVAAASAVVPLPLKGLPPIRGFAIQINDPKNIQKYYRSVKHLQKLGCRWINFVVDARQKDVHSNRVYLNWNLTARPQVMTRLLLYAHQLGIHTLLMPIILLDHATGDQWRGTIKPQSWHQWFVGYRAYIRTYARVAAAGKCSIFSVGSELLSTEKFRGRWLRIVRMTRKIFKGKLIYSANWDHYKQVLIWHELNYVAMNAYWRLAYHPGHTVSTLVQRWRPIQKQVLAFAAKMHRPLLLTEIGWYNLQDTIVEPWNYTGSGPLDPDEQLRAYESFGMAWDGLPKKTFAGAFLWEWMPGGKPSDYGSYSLQGEPALPLMTRWISGK